MTHPVRRLVMVRRSQLVAPATAGMLTGVPLASDAPRPAPVAPPSAVSIANPGSGIPIVGGFVDSVVGTVTGTLFGISGGTRGVACSIAPSCPPVPGRHARRARRLATAPTSTLRVTSCSSSVREFLVWALQNVLTTPAPLQRNT
jgi:hypothetical protein